MKKLLAILGIVGLLLLASTVLPIRAEEKAGDKDNMPPTGFTALFNGKDLTGWQGLVELPERSSSLRSNSRPSRKKPPKRPPT